jgi:preprotein translocase subunit SecA
MTGTAREAAGEFWHIYNLPVLAIPTHRPCLRQLLPQQVYPDRGSKWQAIAEEVKALHAAGRPVLVGTRNVTASEELAALLAAQGISCQLLNAVNHRQEAQIIAAAGLQGAVTIATNMAGRGTDIRLGRGVAELGGLHVIVSELHESRRIDRQLFGRCSRQGEPGSARAYISLDDELLQRFTPPPARKLLGQALLQNRRGAALLTEKSIALAQQAAQRLAFQQRQAVLQTDDWLADSLSFARTEVES